MNDLSADRIIAEHEKIIAHTGGDKRIASEANLLQVVFQANMIGMVVPRAALAFFMLVAYPVFREGNEMTAEVIALAILAEEGYGIDPAGKDTPRRLTADIQAFTAGPDDIEAWFAAHARKLS